DLHARGRGAVAVVTLVARPPPVLADPDLRPALVRDHRRRHHALAEEDVGLEALAGLGAQAVDDECLAVADAVLLVAEPDDCVTVCHSVENAGVGPRARNSSYSCPHSLIGVYSQSRGPSLSSVAGASASGSVAGEAAVPVFFLRLRPPRLPRRVGRLRGAAGWSPFSEGSASRSRPGRWITGAAGASCASCPSSPSSRAGSGSGSSPFAETGETAVFFLRLRPPRLPRRVFFLTGA